MFFLLQGPWSWSRSTWSGSRGKVVHQVNIETDISVTISLLLAGSRRWSYRAECSHKINWTRRRGECGRWWTERGSRSNPKHSPPPQGSVERDRGRGAWMPGWLADWLGERLRSELNMRDLDPQGMLLVRHSLQLGGEGTCAHPMSLSGVGIDTLGWAEVKLELQMGKERAGGGAQCWAATTPIATEKWTVFLWFSRRIYSVPSQSEKCRQWKM